ncbi:MAG: cytochrome-c oxidase, cbb3-type subunit III [Hydrogenovibrio sp.]|uniref:cytochrome-c oxidase, cbb3-type subunit III n=1 Tax=Hydrogenovibrio sp. TaxID=2065821 RepID=UPI0028703BEA|nr:cytochrome-c oxidase, cbb3-type subunit III [Hydrogenovibrio sp.]MDR9498921.1 cytochrome-c oxidase, cbb3-type subunit III [Hydrogenovibrio sp.]
MAQHNPWPDEGNTGHIWDEDIRELDNPPPLWWMLAFYAGFVMIVFYALYYPTIPWTDSHYKGMAGWTQVEEYKEDYQVLENWRDQKFAQEEEQLAALPLKEIIENDELKTYAVKTSKVLFGDYCAGCHGAGGQGNPNFPVLADDNWLWGGKVDQIYTAIEKGRIGNMPARGMMGNLNDEEVEQVADYVIALANGNGDDASVSAGKAVYQKGMCLACHGPQGKPLAANGATNLTDQIWRFSSERDEVIKTIKYGVMVKKDGELAPNTRNAVMPSFADRLPDAEVNMKRLAVYVHALGGGQ